MNHQSNTSVPCLAHFLKVIILFLALSKTNLEYLNIGCSIRAVAAPISFYVFEPLNVRLGIAVDLTV